MAQGPVSSIRNAIAARPASLFAHATYPLARSLEYPGDDGLFGPGSATWAVSGDVATFIGGIRALLIQSIHPEVVAGVDEHSRYETDPLGRLSRTSAYVTATAYGATVEAENAIAQVRRAHQPVRGTSHRGVAYSAGHPAFASWVHNVLVDSFVAAHRVYGPGLFVDETADRFVHEQTRLGAMLGADDLPETARDLRSWIVGHPDTAPSPGMSRTLEFLIAPPLPHGVRTGYQVLFNAALRIVPPPVRATLDLEPSIGARQIGDGLLRFLRWSMGSSPSWWLALERTGAPLPPDVHFRRPPPVREAASLFRPT